MSRISGQRLSQRDITPQVIFLALLIVVLRDIACADGVVTEEEMQRWQTILKRFVSREIKQLTQLISLGMKQHQISVYSPEFLMLTHPLSHSEKLLLISLSYEMSTADGEMDSREKNYLEIVGKQLGIKSQHLAVLEAGFTHQVNVEPDALNEVYFLLDPACFQSADPVFIQAANGILAILPGRLEQETTEQHTTESYWKLKKYQEYRKQLANYCYQISQLIQDCKNHGILPHTLIGNIAEVSQKIKSQRFRLAVVGEFSKGKSTLLNALLGEEIQPVRAIPCSGTVTVIKYGTERRVTCWYKDGRIEEIPFDQYKLKATISKDAALEHRSDELAQSDIEEIIFENPELVLCKNGVEIVDSPGLNEHPDRTSITYKLLQDTDAVIFLTDAMRLLTEKEKELIQDMRYKLNNSNLDEPAENLFILVNFMDMLDNEEDLHDVRTRLENFVINENLLINTGKNRIHYISAKLALKAIQNKYEDEYLKKFQFFTQSLENFLVLERGKVKIRHSIKELNSLITKILNWLVQSQNVLDGNIQLSKAAKFEIFEKIGAVSGRELKMRILINSQKKQAAYDVYNSWQVWYNKLPKKILEKSISWSSQHSKVFEQKERIKEYTNRFLEELKAELNTWQQSSLDIIIKQYIGILDNEILQEINTLNTEFELIDKSLNTNFSDFIDRDIMQVDTTLFFGTLGRWSVNFLGGMLLVSTGLIFLVPLFVSSINKFTNWVDGQQDTRIKQKIIESGLAKFAESQDKITEQINQYISSIFESKIKSFSAVIAQAIALYENLLEQQEKAHNETLEQREAQKMRIYQKRQELEQVQNELEVILSKCTYDSKN
ncbi:dynamin family protein [Nostoc sp. DedSLP04]|uniref:dynamin family protein n=1 Tax=Nostoc sp. DedSLP04 TaxID=3075401 RepID=UPI002AD29328|nr:dynamin family protein [Nostoc sp. DedSLP04]